MKYFLDTNICIYALKNTYPHIKKMMEKLSPSEIAIPSMVKAELYYGAYKSDKKKKVITALDKFLFPFEVIPFSDDVIMTYARIRSDLEKKGNIIGPNDLIIAATTLAYGGMLITHNIKEFERVDELPVEDWAM